MVVGVEQMRKVPLFDFGEPEGFRELGQLHLKEGHGVDETDTGRQTLELEDLTPVTDLTQFETELIQRVDDGITLVPLEQGTGHRAIGKLEKRLSVRRSPFANNCCNVPLCFAGIDVVPGDRTP